MDAELMSLAGVAATAVVQQMAADTWMAARDHLVSFFSRRGSEGTIEGELEVSRGELTTALAAGDERTVSDIEAEWRTRMRRELRANPAAAAELRAVLEELADSPAATGDVQNTISGGTQHGPVVQAGTIGSLRLGGS
ncbi:hypothetical protein ACIRJS_23145 [Streptomyces sp. NPDC102340]|uniref:hypothetical protein n=1 Tax=unclassified Streptomyces TaxID=2593676 RepID=UPI00382DB51E